MERFYILTLVIAWTSVGKTMCSLDAEVLYSNLTSCFNNDIIPLNNANNTMYVGLHIYIVSVNEFDGLSGRLSLTLVFHLFWKDECINWAPENHAGIRYIHISKDKIWTPDIFAQESFLEVSGLVLDKIKVRTSYEGKMVLTTGEVLQVVCSVDVTYFPFDTQTCAISLTSPNYLWNELEFSALHNQLNTSFYKKNNQWKYVSGDVVPSKIEDGPSFLILHIRLKRRAEFFVVYIIVPVVFLSNLNILVFVMPVSSGERMSVAITTFLSFVIYMQIVNNNVPPSSEPIAYIFYYLMFVMAYSSSIMFMCILSLKIHTIETPIPGWLQLFVVFVRCRRCGKKVNALNSESNTAIEDICGKESAAQEESGTGTITWTLIGDTFDKCCFMVFSSVFWAFSLRTFYQLYNNTGLLP